MMSDAIRSAIVVLIYTTAFVCWTTLRADTIYKSIDENGNVSYSTTPPAAGVDSNVINIAPPPSEKNREDAAQRHNSMMEAAQQLDENRQTRDSQNEQQNQQKRETRKQEQDRLDAEINNSSQDYGDLYIRERRPLLEVPPNRPPAHAPILPARPITLPRSNSTTMD